MARSYYVYILTNEYHTTFYTGMTNDIERRIREHRLGAGSEFVKNYNVYKLVFLQEFQDAKQAIDAEKVLKRSSRQRKINLIAEMNPMWEDLY
ncbi:GIY-YIG nuclease family protein [bacterium]|nr:GIY-YIG nuclease family protein [bacterium]